MTLAILKVITTIASCWKDGAMVTVC